MGGEAIGAKTIDLEWVQVHPTGLVKPDDPDAKIKFLAAEALRGVGGLVFDANGKRFANELGRRDYVNRLGGNSLLDCVVFGRVAGRAASKYMFGADGKFRSYPIDAKDKSVSKITIA